MEPKNVEEFGKIARSYVETCNNHLTLVQRGTQIDLSLYHKRLTEISLEASRSDLLPEGGVAVFSPQGQYVAELKATP